MEQTYLWIPKILISTTKATIEQPSSVSGTFTYPSIGFSLRNYYILKDSNLSQGYPLGIASLTFEASSL